MARRTRGQRGSRSRNRAVNPVRIGTGIGNQLSAPLRGVLQNHAVHTRASNPTTQQYVIGGAVLAVTGVAAYFLLRDDTPAVQPSGTGGLEGSVDPGYSPDVCGSDARYPGFAWDGVDCSPSSNTLPGIYIVDDCQDFIFVTGDDGPQPDDLEARIANAVRTSERKGANFDPTNVATSFLQDWWPECAWPPAPDAAPRIVQMYMALSIMIGRLILRGGGWVFGANTMEQADELIGDRFIELGYDDFRPDIVSEIPLPDPNDATLDPDAFDNNQIDTGGLDFDEDYVPPQGGIQLPDGGQGPVQPEYGSDSDSIDIPAPLEHSQSYPMVDDDAQILFWQETQANTKGWPDGVFYARMDFTTQFDTASSVDVGGISEFAVQEYGQRELIDYQITVSGNAVQFEKVAETAYFVPGTKSPNMELFGCTFVSQCGFNGQYNSYFEPRLNRNAQGQLVVWFRSREVIDDAKLDGALLNVDVSIEFSTEPF